MNLARASKIAAVVVVAAAALLAYRSGVFTRVADPKSFAASVLTLGAWGYVGFVVAYALLQPFGIPGTVFIVAAPLIWPWPVAFGLSMAGTMAASVIGFSYARFVARDWVSARIPSRFRKYDEALARSAFRTVFTLRLLFWMPQVLHAFLGVSKVSFWTHFWGSLLGYVPPLLLVSYVGSELFDGAGQLQPRALWMLGVLAIASLLLSFLLRHFDRRRTNRVLVRDSRARS
jgi:uncharacterized membrane protein YdjX (TVP38/TMEM64 family)